MPAVKPLPARPTVLRVQNLLARPVGVDREAKIIRGYVLAQEGPFKSEGRGEFDRAALAEIVRLTNAARKGLRSRFAHPSLSDDGIGKYLGRARGAWLDQSGPVWRARADLHLAASSFDTPSGDLGGYVLRLAAEDPDALSTSLVIKPEEEYRLNPDGTRQKDADGNPLPPLWRPVALFATDVVDTGDAVDGMLGGPAGLSAADLPDAAQRQGWAMLDRVFAGQPADVVRERCAAYVERYLSRDSAPAATRPPAAPSPPALPPPDRPNRDRAGAILARCRLTPGG